MNLGEEVNKYFGEEDRESERKRNTLVIYGWKFKEVTQDLSELISVWNPD